MRIILLYIAIATLLISCGNNKADNQPATETAAAKATPPPPIDTPSRDVPQPAPETAATPNKAVAAAWKGVMPITDANFEQQVLRNPGLTVVDFSAVWCGPCKLLKPIFEKTANDFAGKASFATIDVDDNPAVSQQYNVSSIPLLLFFKNGKQVNKIVGLVDKQALTAAVKKSL
jgi:thioredoxin 1